ncbi:MAG: hypothetical protein U0X75_27635 [Acidobacteriota bacterium]
MWNHPPSADELLTERYRSGWQPTPSPLRDGARVLGHAACLLRGSDTDQPVAGRV